MNHIVEVVGQVARLRRWRVNTPTVFRQHSHAQTCFELVLSGEYTETVQDQAVRRRAGNASLVVANVDHACHYSAAVHSLCLEFLREQDNRQLQAQGLVQLDARQIGDSVWRIGQGLIEESQHPDEWSGVAVDAYCAELLVRALRSRRIGPQPPSQSQSQSWQRIVLQRLHDGHQAPASVHELAALVKLHPGHLAKLFRAEWGVPIATYQRQLRLQQASRDLMRGVPTVEVALSAGYSAQSQFSTAFKKAFALSPGQFRKRYGGD
jgi:AraC-like DNA-binding protein